MGNRDLAKEGTVISIYNEFRMKWFRMKPLLVSEKEEADCMLDA